MKRLTTLLVAFFLCYPFSFAGAEDFLEAPVFPQGREVNRTGSRLELKTDLSHKDVHSFYKEALKDAESIKFREWKDATYIEDDGSRP